MAPRASSLNVGSADGARAPARRPRLAGAGAATARRYTVSLTVFLVAWWLLALARIVEEVLFPAPMAVWFAFSKLTDQGILLPWTVKSIERVCVGFLAAAAIGVAVGLLVGWSRPVREYSEPVIEVLRPIPPIAWIPLALAWFGPGRGYEMWIVGVAVFFPTLISTYTGVASVDPITIRTALTMGAGQWRLFKDVILPGALPAVLSGLRIGWGFGWWSLVAAEMIGSTSGLGWLIFSAYQSAFDLAAVMSGMILIGAIGLISHRGFLLLERRLLRWRLA